MNRLIQTFLDAWLAVPGANEAPGAVMDGEPQRAIDDGGGYGDPHADTRPDFVRQDTDGWRIVIRLKR